MVARTPTSRPRRARGESRTSLVRNPAGGHGRKLADRDARSQRVPLAPMNELLKKFTARDLLQDYTSGLDERLDRGPVVAYVGLDPTADSLHVGSLVPILGAAWLQRFGHTPIVLMGGGTGMVGDPSGKRSERPIMPVEEIDRNVDAIGRQVGRFLDFQTTTRNAARLRNNADWLRRVPLMEFLRDTGKHLTLGFMLQKESVRAGWRPGSATPN